MKRKPSHRVIDLLTGTVVGQGSLKRCSDLATKLDNAYGGVRYSAQRIPAIVHAQTDMIEARKAWLDKQIADKRKIP